MDAIQRLSLLVLPVALLAFTQPAFAQDATSTAGAPPAKMLAFLAIANLPKTLQSLEAIGAQIDPEQMQPGMLQGQIGGMLGDPTFANLDTSKPVVAIVFAPQPGSPTPPIALYIPAKAASPYDQALSAFLQMQSEFTDGLLVAAQTPEALSFAKGQSAAYQTIVKQGYTDDAHLFLGLEDVLASYGPFLEMGLQGLLPMLEQGVQGVDGQAKAQAELGILFVRAYVHTLRSLLYQSKSLQVGLSLSAAAIDGRVLYQPKTGTAVAGVLSGAKPGANAAAAHLPEKFSLAYTGQLDPPRMSAFVSTLAGEISAVDPKLKDALTGETIEALKNFLAQCSGNFAAAMVGADDFPFHSTLSVGVKEEGAYLAAMEGLLKLYGPEGVIHKALGEASPGMETELKRKAREHAGVPVHHLAMKYDLTNTPEETKAFLAKTPTSYDLAFVKAHCLGATSSALVNTAIDKAKAGSGNPAPLAAQKRYGNGQNVYVDVDAGAMLSSFMELIPEGEREQAEQFLSALKGAPPVMAAAALHGGKAEKQFHLPVDLFARLAKAGRATIEGDS